MEYLEKYDDFILKIYIDDRDSEGASGVLFNPNSNDYSYVITAKHCIVNHEVNNLYDIERIKIYSKNLGYLIPQKIITNKKYDLAIILINKVSTKNKLITIDKFTMSEKLFLYGFPVVLNEDSDVKNDGQRFSCKVNALKGKDRVEIVPTQSSDYNHSSFADQMTGFSGSGIYLEKNEEIYLVGIYTEVKEEFGSFNASIGYKITSVNSLLKEENLESLVPVELSNFESYINSAFDGHDEITELVLKMYAREINHLSPNDIAIRHKEKLLIPHSEDWNYVINSNSLWEGWIKLLTYNFIDTDVPVIKNKNEVLDISRKTRKKLFYPQYKQKISFFFSDKKKLLDVSYEFYSKNFNDLQNNEIIVINTEDRINGKRKYKESDFKNGSINISNPNKLEPIINGFEIDKALYGKNTTFLHIDAFSEKISELEFSNYNLSKDQNKIINKIKKTIEGVFE